MFFDIRFLKKELLKNGIIFARFFHMEDIFIFAIEIKNLYIHYIKENYVSSKTLLDKKRP